LPGAREIQIQVIGYRLPGTGKYQYRLPGASYREIQVTVTVCPLPGNTKYCCRFHVTSCREGEYSCRVPYKNRYRFHVTGFREMQNTVRFHVSGKQIQLPGSGKYR
jgi:hypothetical protein